MAFVLLIEKNITFETIYAINLNVYVGVDVVSKKNHEDGIDVLKMNEKVDLIITKNEIDGQRTAVEIYKYLQSSQRDIPLIVIGPDPVLEKKAMILTNNAPMIEVIRAAAKVLNVTPKDMVQKQVPDYYPIPIHYFASLQKSLWAVYQKTKGNAGSEYVKRYEVNAPIPRSDIEDLIRQGTTKLYVDKLYRLSVANAVTSQLTGQLNSKNLSAKERVDVTNNSLEVLREQMLSAGMSDDTVDLAKASIKSMTDIVKSSPQLSTLLSKLMDDKLSLRYRCTQLTIFLSFHILNNIEWGTPEQQDKLTFIALFHDILLEEDKFFKIRSSEDLSKVNLTEKENTKVLAHALDAARLVQNFPQSPLGAEVIIKQHHGSLSGAGFPKSYSNNLSPLAIIFIVCEEYAFKLLSKKEGEHDHKQIMEELREKYSKSLYKKAIRALENLSL